MSRSGILLESPLTVALESIQQLQLTLHGHEVTLEARVRHVRRVGDEGNDGNSPVYLIGLEFMSPLDVPITQSDSVTTDL
jgi:hypothetical protein